MGRGGQRLWKVEALKLVHQVSTPQPSLEEKDAQGGLRSSAVVQVSRACLHGDAAQEQKCTSIFVGTLSHEDCATQILPSLASLTHPAKHIPGCWLETLQPGQRGLTGGALACQEHLGTCFPGTMGDILQSD